LGPFTAHPGQPSSLPRRKRISIQVATTSDFSRHASVVIALGEWCAGSFPFLLVVLAPLQSVIDPLFDDDQSTFRTGDLAGIGCEPPLHSGQVAVSSSVFPLVSSNPRS
jgi:hypothetical protein